MSLGLKQRNQRSRNLQVAETEAIKITQKMEDPGLKIQSFDSFKEVEGNNKGKYV